MMDNEPDMEIPPRQEAALKRFRAAQEEWGAAMQECAQAGIPAESAFSYVGMELPPAAAAMFTEFFAAMAASNPAD